MNDPSGTGDSPAFLSAMADLGLAERVLAGISKATQ